MCSLLLLVVVNPLSGGCQNAAISNSIFEVGSQLEQLVCCLELAFIFGTAVTNHYLGGILVGHNDCRLGEARAEGAWVVGLQGLLDHTCVEVVSLLVNSPTSKLLMDPAK